jgi:Xaa-Pro aminopeptidase
MISRLPLLLVSALTVSLSPLSTQLPPFGGAAEFRADLAERRAKTMAGLGTETILVAWSAPARVYSTDVNYEYRQDSNLLYLTGIDQEETILVLVPGAKTAKEIIFSSEANLTREHWNGHTLTPAEVTEASGVAAVYPLAAFRPFVDALLAGAVASQTPGLAAGEFAAFHDAVKAGKARIGILERLGPTPAGVRACVDSPPPAAPGTGAAPAPPSPVPGSRAAWVAELQAKTPGIKACNALPIVFGQRQVKTAYEQKVLRRSVEISAEAHIEGMKAARPGRWEYEVEAAIEYWYMKNGAMSWGYPSIVGSGPNATTLHYGKSTRQMQDGDLLLVDAAANFQGLTGDITRTYPVNGKFTPAQREIYELVLQAQEAGIAAAKPNGTIAAITAAVRATFAEGLTKLGLITDPSQVGIWFTHGPVHGIGIDVHDPNPETLGPGSAFVIEPGLYFPEYNFENIGRGGRGGGVLAPPQDRDAVMAILRPAFQKYKGIGVRIEDSFLMTEQGPITLSARAPRLVEEIEKLVGSGK